MRVHHYGIAVKDLDAAAEFYIKALNMKELFRTRWMGEELLFLESGSMKIELIAQTGTVGEAVHVAYQTDDLEYLAGRLQQEGIVPSEGPYVLENGWRTVFYEGPSGEMIEFVEEQ
ncbi:VOC family protein [Fictibacillus sp. B-59209]|uniref:VOC family protein n=1 Tax=Fictibacillus sp. B-59209 TaxID=3024873 RepID=UPI002E1F1305|nr:VOC family protein [Fictibacillus sp. B-59209]